MDSRVDKLLASVDNYLDKIQCDVPEGSAPFECAVATCRNKFVNFGEHQKSPFKFHNFPKNYDIAAKWKVICRIPKNTPVNTLKICSVHFSLDDYIRNFKAEFLNPALKRPLKEEALPSCFVPPLEPLELLEDSDKEEIGVKCEDQADDIDVGKVVLADVDNIKAPLVESSVGSEVGSLSTTASIALKVELALLNKQISTTENKLNRKKKILEQKKKILEERKKKLSLLKKKSQHNTGNNISSFLSKAQIDLLKGEKKVYWSDDDLANAFSLRHMGGKDFYLYLKNTLNYPLPSLSCVQIWAGN